MEVDVLIIGAGLSGIGAAYHLQKHNPRKTYAIVEARERLGGTWDLFRYPGVRSDSDMFTLGYSFKPWTDAKAIADGPSILAYVRETAEENGIASRIRYQHRVVSADWSSPRSKWTVQIDHLGERVQYQCNFTFACAGYYDYESGYSPTFPGIETFTGCVVHPQKWPTDVEWEGKRVVVIGSGATAITLVPELSKKAAHVTMLQRSPTYVLSRPSSDLFADFARAHLPATTAYALTRWKNVLLGMAFYAFCRRFPCAAKKLLVAQVQKLVGPSVDVQKHFEPYYNPWDQRVCMVPDDDLFVALREGRASVETDTIETFTPTGIRLTSGKELAADMVVTATGLRLKFLGGAALSVDGAPVEPTRTFAYKGLMLSDVPNFAFAVGYTNASWTLKCDLASEYVCRLLRFMDERGYQSGCPRQTDPSVKPEPLIDFTSGYVQRAVHMLPHQGCALPWKVYQNYIRDLALFRHAPLDDDAMEFR